MTVAKSSRLHSGAKADTARQATYELLSDEYYDPIAHPTCHNLNRLSRLFLTRWIPEQHNCREILELGAGDSAVAAILHERGQRLSGLEVQDSSAAMLAHSRRWRDLGVITTLSDARSMSRGNGTVSLLVASLADPYNLPSFWLEAARVVRPRGQFLFTLPSFEWAARFRAGQTDDSLHVARFVLRDGRVLDVPSYIYPLSEQVRMIASAGFMLMQFESLGDSLLPSDDARSPKVDVFGPDVSSLVWGFLAVRLHNPLDDQTSLQRWLANRV